MRIATLYDRLPPALDGGADFVARLGLELTRLGHEHAVVIPEAHATQLAYIPGSDQIRTPPWSSYASVDDVIRLLRGWHADVVHVVYPGKDIDGYVLPLEVASQRGLATVITVFPAGLRGRSVHEWRLLLRALHRSARIVVSAPEQRSVLNLLLPWLAKRLDEIPSGGAVPTADFRMGGRDEARRSLGLDPLGIYFGHFGYIYRGKRPLELVAALAGARTRGADFKIMFIGGQGLRPSPSLGAADAFVAALASNIVATGLSDSILQTGFLSAQLAETYIRACDAIVFPANRFGLGRSTAVAALGCGVPLVVPAPFPGQRTADGAAAEGIVLYSARAQPRLTDVLVSLATDDRLRMRMRRGAEAGASNWSWSALARRYAGVLLAARHSSG